MKKKTLPSTRLAAACGAALLLLASACGPGEAPPVTDYALSAEAMFSAGDLEGPGVLNRVVSASWLADGGMVVGDVGVTALKYFDARGRLVRAVGPIGQEPGDFQSLDYARAIHGDTVVTWDSGQDRISFFDPEGRVVGTVEPDLGSHTVEIGGRPAPAVPDQVVALYDGRLVVRPGRAYTLVPRRADFTVIEESVAPQGLYRQDYPFFLLGRSGRVTRTLGPVPGEMRYVAGALKTNVPFSPEIHLAAGRDHFAMGSGSPFAFAVADGRGRMETVTVDRPGAPVTDEMWGRHLERMGSLGDDEWSALRRSLPRLDTLPAYSDLLMDDEDRVWVQEFDPFPYADRPLTRQWLGFDEDGRLRARLTVPEGLRVLDIANGRLTGVVRGEFGANFVRVYRLEEAPRPTGGALAAAVLAGSPTPGPSGR